MDHLNLTPFPSGSYIIMKNFGSFGEVIQIGHIQRREQGWIQFLKQAMTMFFEVILVEVHINQAFINLDNTILVSGRNPEFFFFDIQDNPG
jgi:hypothetical protein